MPFNGSGTYTPPGAGFPFVTATTISATVVNGIINDLATALTNCVTRDGQSPMTATFPLGGQVMANLGAGSVTTPALAFANGAQTGIYSPGANQFGITIAGTAAITINANRQVTIGQPVSGDALTLSGTGVGRASNWFSTSDRRLKEDFAPVSLADAMDFIRSLQAWTFKKQGIEDLGLIAQDVAATRLGSRAVRYDGDGFMSVNYGPLVVAALLPVVQYLCQQLEQTK